MTAYTFRLKHMVLLDVFAIAAGFVLRAAGGAVAVAVPISPWLYVCTVLLALFIGFGKRRHELLLLESAAGAHRRNLDEYTPELLDQFILVTAAATIMAYSLYTFVATNVPSNHAMMLTIPFVLYAVFRYLFLIHRRGGGGSPEQLLLSDHALLASIALWGIACVVILYV
jgi:4-hydroxybenzoate polyprenyltransferase